MSLNNLNYVTFLLAALTVTVCTANQPSYQVSLFANLHPRVPPMHFCNGVIVQSRLILTTASCVHYKFSSDNGPALAITTSMISVISGSSVNYEELSLQVSDIIVDKNFNYTTGENDLAILRLSGILPLDKRNDISWITLAGDDDFDSCLANFYVRNTISGAANYIQSVHLPLLDADVCEAYYQYDNKREKDVCSLYYYLSPGINCNAIETLQNYNVDRGTGLICDNKLMGLLSTILPEQNKRDCVDTPIKAYYTAIIPNIGWIFDVITEEDFNMLNSGDYISSSPYDGEANAHLVEPADPTPTPSPVSSPQQNMATGLSSGKCEFLTLIFGIYFLLQSLNGKL